MIEGVIFDMDGVIMDSEPIHYKVEKAILANFNQPFEFEDHARFVGQTTRDLWKTLCEERNLPQGFEVLALLDNADYMQELEKGDIEPIDGLIGLLENIQNQQIPMVVASSAIRKNIETVISRFEIGSFFKGSVSGQDVENTKPNPEIFFKAAKVIDIKPENCLVIEDAKHGVEAAKAAGMFCIALRNLNSGNQDLSQADLIVNSLSEIDLNFVNQLINKEK
ncbi:HAD family phosphatase [Reichenbachiella sp. MALMAid0571]|uniref:HAD family hydrolase n=1 Tax=Reichenbachiella sp. MALMAid0571 TaxID=3143939 RepID=UPI0032DE5252